MNTITRKQTKLSGVFGRLGLAAIVSLISLAVAFLCLLFPPWWEVECARRE